MEESVETEIDAQGIRVRRPSISQLVYLKWFQRGCHGVSETDTTTSTLSGV